MNPRSRLILWSTLTLAALATGCGRTSLGVPTDGGAAFDAPPPDGATDAGCTTNAQCDDGIFCNGAELCAAGLCVAGSPFDCSDPVDCTVDACDEASRSCTHLADPTRCGDEELCDPARGCVTVPCVTDFDCNDGRVCDGLERCVDGTCRAGVPLSCDDANPCTDDRCDEAGGGCTNTVRDRDGDGFGDGACGGTDCDDSRPAIHPGAIEVCDDGVDDDCNGAVDCADVRCAMTPACVCAPVEDCASGRDTDCDGLIGCADPDCAPRPECATCTPTDLGRRIGPAVATGSTAGGINRVMPPCGTPMGNAPEAIFRWTAPFGGTFTFDTFGSSYDTLLYLRVACEGPDIPGACNDDSGGVQSRVTLSLAAGRTIVIVVDGFASSSGSYVLNISSGTAAEVCNNGADDDGDGLIDCVDPDCTTSPLCCTPRMEVCTNAVDDDCDRLVDCADPDCRFSPSCCVPSPERCGGGVDEDCDRLIDCADPDCTTSPLCCVPRPELCTGGLDEDCDGRVDCGDPDCATSPACCIAMPEMCGNGRDDDCDTRVDCADPDCAASPLCCVPSPEICTDGRDNDCDRRVDCADPDCDTAPSCCVPVPESCDNGMDDDCDTRVDCADPDCAGVPVCCVPAPESCSDGRDNDCDMAVDCADPDCAADPSCAPCPDADLGSRLGRPVATGTTVGAPNRFTPSCATSNAPDRAFTWTAPAAGDYFIDTFGSSYDTMLTLHTSCTGPELPGMCNDDVPGMGTRSRLRVTLRAGSRILIVVDGWSTSSGPFVLNITRAFPDEIGLCGDGIDNDGDLATDCADSDCAMDTACLPPP